MQTQSNITQTTDSMNANSNNSKENTPSVREKGRGRIPVRISNSSFETIDMKDDIPLQSWYSSAGPEKGSTLPPLYRPSDPVMDEYMRPIPNKASGELPPRPATPWYKRRWMYLLVLVVFVICLVPGIVLAVLPKHTENTDPKPTDVVSTASTISTSSTRTITRTIPATIVTDIITESLTIPVFKQTILSPTITQSGGFTPLSILTTKITSTKLVNTVIPIARPSEEPSTATTVLFETETFTVAATPSNKGKGADDNPVARKITLDNHIYTTVTETVTDTITSTRSRAKWITKTHSNTKGSTATSMSSSTPGPIGLRARGIFDWNLRSTRTRTEIVHTEVTVTESTTTTIIVDAPAKAVSDDSTSTHCFQGSSDYSTLPNLPIDLKTCQLVHDGVPTSNERCRGLCAAGYCYAYWNIIPCDQWACCESCGCYNNTLTPPMAANASSRAWNDCRPGIPSSANTTMNSTLSSSPAR